MTCYHIDFALSRIYKKSVKYFRLNSKFCTVVRFSAVIMTIITYPTFAQMMNSDPMFPASETGARSVNENTLENVNIGLPVTAQDAENDTLIYTITGEDSEFFNFNSSNGQLSTKEPLNFEDKASYTVLVGVSDQKDVDGNTDTEIDAEIAVTITIMNIDEPGTIFLFPETLRVGNVTQATVSDPDGIIGYVSWNWHISEGEINWWSAGSFIDRYVPSSSVGGMSLQTTVSYTDGEGSNKTVVMVSDHVIEAQESAPEISVVTLVSNLNIPWGMTFTPDGTMLFTEREGKLSSRFTDGTIQTISADLSDLYVKENNGLLDIVVDPNFTSNRRFYTCQGHTDNQIHIIAWTINETYTEATRVDDPLVGNIPSGYLHHHPGCRLRFGPQGYLWIATGDGFLGTTSQDLNSLAGKVLRVDALTGEGAPTNPFTVSPKIYTYGHRNPQGLALRPHTEQMWLVEHGPYMDDEINLLSSGGNYGWYPGPDEESPNLYNERDTPMTDLVRYPDAIVAQWSSGQTTLAPSGGIFLEGEDWEEWEGRLAVATLKDQSLRIFAFTEEGTLESHIVPSELKKNIWPASYPCTRARRGSVHYYIKW